MSTQAEPLHIARQPSTESLGLAYANGADMRWPTLPDLFGRESRLELGRCPLRHARRARSHKRGSLATYRSILGGLLVEMWHSQLGIGLASGNVDTWTGQIGGRVLQAPGAAQRPTYASSSFFSSGKSVVGSAVTGTKYVGNNALTAVWTAGQLPYVMGVFGCRTVPAGNHFGFRTLNSVSSAAGAQFFTSASTMNGGSGSSAAFSDTTAGHTFENFLDAAGTDRLYIDGSLVGSNGAGLSQIGNVTQIAAGAATSGTAAADWDHALYLLCSSVPTAAQRAAITVLAKAEFGY